MADILEMADAGPHPIEVQRAEGMMRIVLSSPPANALSLAMIEALLGALAEARDDRSCRVVILAAKGAVFSAGHDLKEIAARRADADGGRAFFETLVGRSSALMQAIVGLPRPVIAEVNGLATATGCQLVASCDLVIASEEARFCTPGVNIGLFCSTPMVALARSIAPRHAMEMLLTGEAIDARTAREFGLVNRVVPPDYIGTVVGKYATAIASKSPFAMRVGKAAFHSQSGLGLAEAYEHTGRVMVENLMAHDAEEGIGAFLEKRKPEWSGD